MPIPVLASLALFDVAMLALALAPDLSLSHGTSVLLHLSVAAINMAVLTSVTRRPLVTAAVLAPLMIGVEAVQAAIPGRGASVEDVVVDLAGLVVGWVGAGLFATARRTGARPAGRLR